MTRLQELKMKYRDKYKEDVIIDLYKKMLDDDKYIKINKYDLVVVLSAIGCSMIVIGYILLVSTYLGI